MSCNQLVARRKKTNTSTDNKEIRSAARSIGTGTHNMLPPYPSVPSAGQYQPIFPRPELIPQLQQHPQHPILWQVGGLPAYERHFPVQELIKFCSLKPERFKYQIKKLLAEVQVDRSLADGLNISYGVHNPANRALFGRDWASIKKKLRKKGIYSDADLQDSRTTTKRPRMGHVSYACSAAAAASIHTADNEGVMVASRSDHTSGPTELEGPNQCNDMDELDEYISKLNDEDYVDQLPFIVSKLQYMLDRASTVTTDGTITASRSVDDNVIGEDNGDGDDNERPYAGPLLDVPVDFSHDNFKSDKALVRFTDQLFNLANIIAQRPENEEYIWKCVRNKKDTSAVLLTGNRIEVFISPDDKEHNFCHVYKTVFQDELGVDAAQFTKFTEQVTFIQNPDKFETKGGSKKGVNVVSFLLKYSRIPEDITSQKNVEKETLEGPIAAPKDADSPQIVHNDNDGSRGNMFGTMTCSRSESTEYCDISRLVPPSGKVGVKGLHHFLKRDEMLREKASDIDKLMAKMCDHDVNSKLCNGYGHLVLADPSTLIHNEPGKLCDAFQVKVFRGSHPHRGPATSPNTFRMVLFFTLFDDDGRTKEKKKSESSGDPKNKEDYDGLTQISREKLIWFLHRNLLLKHNYSTVTHLDRNGDLVANIVPKKFSKHNRDTEYTLGEAQVLLTLFIRFFKDSASMWARDTTLERMPLMQSRYFLNMIYDTVSLGQQLRQKAKSKIEKLRLLLLESGITGDRHFIKRLRGGVKTTVNAIENYYDNQKDLKEKMAKAVTLFCGLDIFEFANKEIKAKVAQEKKKL